MVNVYLLKEYQDSNRGDIISVSNNVAFGLVDTGVARNTTTRDFLVKPEIGTSKSFKKPPSKAFIKEGKGRMLKS